MYLTQSKKKNGRIYLSVAESYRENGKTKTRSVRSLGYVDELEKEHDDPIAYWKQWCRDETAAAKAARDERFAPVSIGIHPAQKIDKRAVGRKNIGSAALMAVYNAMGLAQVCRNAQRGTRAGYDLNAVLRLLVCERILNPGSKLAAFENKDRYFFRTAFGRNDVYRALDALAANGKRMVSAINRYVDREGMRDATSVYYDVTNYYFEIDEPDELRRKGVSKERRKSPIVQMGLLQDKNAIPITYEVFPGNTNDCETMVPILANMKRDYALDRIIMVADKGNNTSNNIAACVGRGDGFVVSQSIRGTKSNRELREWAISEEGYRERGESGDFKVKSRQDTKVITVEGPDGKPRKVPIEVKTVAFWSRKYQQRARREREETLRKAAELVRNPGLYSAATHYGAARYVKGLSVDKATGEVLKPKSVLAFNQEKLAADEACDGYYCLITSEYELPDEEVIDIYKGLWRIEESFKVTKSDLETRPVYCSTPEHIKAHFLTCYVALCILRILQLKTNNEYSAGTVAGELAKMCGTNVDANWWVFDHRSDASDAICASVGIDLTRRNMQLQDIKKAFDAANPQ